MNFLWTRYFMHLFQNNGCCQKNLSPPKFTNAKPPTYKKCKCLLLKYLSDFVTEVGKVQYDKF